MLFYYLFMRLRHERRQDFNYSSLIQFAFRFPYALIIKKILSIPFFISGCAGGSSQADKT